MAPTLLLVLAALAFPAAGVPRSPAPSHPDSHSSSRLTVEGERVRLELRCQTAALIERFGGDRNTDLRYDEGELAALREQLAAYVEERYALFSGGAAESGVGSRLDGELTSLETSQAGDSIFDEQWIHFELAYQAAQPLEDLRVEVHLFEEENPFHRDSATLVWNGEEPASWLFDAEGRSWFFEPAAARRPGVFLDFVGLGFHHILSGYDHIAFLVALLVASRRLKSLVGVVTAFTAAHSVTLALAALGLVHVPGRLVELAIALSIAYVAFENLLIRRPSSRWIEAFVFGLVHGLGFAGFLSDSLIFEPLKATALVGFNLGVEAGQLSVVVVAALALRFLPGDRSSAITEEDGTPVTWFTPRWMRLAASLSVAAVGLYWFGERAGWLA